MTIIDGDNYTQLNFLNVTDILRVDGVIVTSGGGDVVGPISAVDSNFAAFDGTTGELIKDSELNASSFGDVDGPTGAVDDNIAVFDSTTGKLIKDSGVPISPGITIIGVTDPENAGDVVISNAQIAIGGSTYIIKDESGAANSTDKITITGEGGQTIDDETEIEIMTGYGVVRLYSDENNLFSW